MTAAVNKDPEIFELTDGERIHPLWARLTDHFETQLQMLRQKNDNPQSEMETATLRGRIAALKAVLALGDDQPPTGEESDT